MTCALIVKSSVIYIVGMRLKYITRTPDSILLANCSIRDFFLLQISNYSSYWLYVHDMDRNELMENSLSNLIEPKISLMNVNPFLPCNQNNVLSYSFRESEARYQNLY